MLNRILSHLKSVNASPRLVGGCVRDKIMGFEPKDFDVEVSNISAAELLRELGKFGKVDSVGASFGVIKLFTEEGDFDFSLPRRENKTGKGHKGFMIEPDPFMSPVEAASRRDFTMNSLWQEDDQIIDPFGGLKDIENKVLRHTSHKFAEDPLRVLRGMQFAGRFNMKVHSETAQLCASLVSSFSELALERVWGEWQKWAEKSVKPSMGLRFLVETGWIELFPEISDLIACPQDPEWHPEGDAFVHTCEVVDAMAQICDRDNITGEERAISIFGALVHDFGKPSTTIFERGHWRAPAHDQAGVALAINFMTAIGAPVKIINKVAETTREHMIHVHSREISPKIVRRLLVRLQFATLDELIRVIEADHSGRPPLPKMIPEQVLEIREIAVKEAQRVKPILMGRHLIDLGLKPGPHFSEILGKAFEAQIEGEINSVEEAIEWIKVNIDL